MSDKSLLIVAATSTVIAFRRDTGQIAWKFESTMSILGLQAKLGGAMDLAIVKNRVYVATRDKIICLDYATGAVIGQVPLASATRRPAFLIEDDRIYYTGADRVICLSLDGQLVWQTPHGITLTDGPAMGVPGNVRQGDEVH